MVAWKLSPQKKALSNNGHGTVAFAAAKRHEDGHSMYANVATGRRKTVL
jgi:hypothetical protein